jgi:L-alanine-DL-glutamate epimerase-like enolase superfamily enzyme
VIADVTPFVVNVSPKSNWFFIRVESDDGTTGYGEATLYGRETPQLAYLEHSRPCDPRSCNTFNLLET